MAGINFDLTEDSNILLINSPKNFVAGPYKIVFKNIEERWAIVTLDWDCQPRLGIRWFWGKSGNPISRAYPTWFIIPSSLSGSIMNGLPLDFKFKSLIEEFLAGKLSGSELQNTKF